MTCRKPGNFPASCYLTNWPIIVIRDGLYQHVSDAPRKTTRSPEIGNICVSCWRWKRRKADSVITACLSRYETRQWHYYNWKKSLIPLSFLSFSVRIKQREMKMKMKKLKRKWKSQSHFARKSFFPLKQFTRTSPHRARNDGKEFSYQGR